MEIKPYITGEEFQVLMVRAGIKVPDFAEYFEDRKPKVHTHTIYNYINGKPVLTSNLDIIYDAYNILKERKDAQE